MLELKHPIQRARGRLVLEFGATWLEVAPEHGGRITSLRHAGVELLRTTGASNYADAFGSTFWPSPQRWPWPPPAEIDHAEYAASVDIRGVIALQGRASPATRLQIAKTFSADLGREAIDIEYAMTNVGEQAARWAPWEVTRVAATGLAFWPTGGAPFGDKPLRTSTAFGHTWCDPRHTAGEAKVFADAAAGYLAYALGDRLLIKQFPKEPAGAAAPDEAPIELYVNADHDYLELENQGAYCNIDAHQTLRWRVTWYARQLPRGLLASSANQDLVAFVAQTLE